MVHFFDAFKFFDMAFDDGLVFDGGEQGGDESCVGGEVCDIGIGLELVGDPLFIGLWTAEDIEEGVVVFFLVAEPFVDGVECGFAFFVGGPADVVDEAEFAGEGGEAFGCVIGPEHETVFGAAGEHAVGFDGDFGDKVVHHDADVGLIAAEEDEFLVSGEAYGVESGEEPLGAGFFVAAGAVDLAGEEEPLIGFGHAGGVDLIGADHVVLDGVTVFENFCVFAAFDVGDDVVLDIGGE